MQSGNHPIDITALRYYIDTAAALVCVLYAALSHCDGNMSNATTRDVLYVALDFLDSAQDTIDDAS